MFRRLSLASLGLLTAACPSSPPAVSGPDTEGGTATTTGGLDVGSQVSGGLTAEGVSPTDADSSGGSAADQAPTIEAFTVNGSGDDQSLTEAAYIQLNVVAFDDRAVEQVEFLFDGIVVGFGELESEQVWGFEFLISGALEFNGPHELSCRVTDDAGNSSQSAVIALDVAMPAQGQQRWERELQPNPGGSVLLGNFTANSVTIVDDQHLVVVGDTSVGVASMTRLTRDGNDASWATEFYESQQGGPSRAVVTDVTPGGQVVVAGSETVTAPMEAEPSSNVWLRGYTPTGTEVFGGTFNVAGGGNDSAAVDLAVSATGDLFVAIQDAPSVGFLARFDAEGAQQWTRTTSFYPSATGLSSTGSLLAAGHLSGEIFVGMFNPEGEELWRQTAGTESGFSSAYAVASLPSGDIVVAGEIGAAGGSNAWIRGYSPDGKEIRWTRTYDYGGIERFADIAVGPRAEIFAVGETQFYCPSLCIDPDIDTLIAKLSADGEKVWELVEDFAQRDWARGVDVDDVGLVYLVGGQGAGGEFANYQWWVRSYNP